MKNNFFLKRLSLSIIFALFISFSCCFAEEGAGIIVSQDPVLISLDVKGMDLIEILKMLASKNNINLVIDKDVGGKATLFLKDVSVQEAFDVVLASSQLAARTEGGITRIMSMQDYERLYGSRPDDSKKLMRVKLRYADPRDIAVVLNQVKSNIGQIIVDEAAGAIMLLDTQEKNQQMSKMIKDMDRPLKTEVFNINYAKSQTLAETLNDVVTKNVGKIKIDARSNKIAITDYADNLDRIRIMLASFDEQTKEVLIDAKIVQVNISDKTSMGVDWEYVLNEKFKVKGMFGQMISTTGNKWTIGSASPSGKNDYGAVLEALQTIGETEILSSPRLTVTNNEEAKILVGSKQVYVTTSAFQSQTSTETAESVNFVDVGVRLFVTPTITHDGHILMKINPEVSSVVQNYTTASGNEIPIVETSQAETTVLVQDGASIIIGGLMKEEKIKKVNKIPILGNVPFLGALFRNSSEEKKKTELMIFLTCHIIEP